jgi:peptidoglycan hydrolase-like protein with peptidoglycan-binding domain
LRNPRRTTYDDDDRSGSPLAALASVLQFVARRPKDAIAVGLAVLAAGGGMANALFLQSGPHPAPIFAPQPVVKIASNESTGAVMAMLPRPRPSELDQPKADAPPANRLRPEIVAEIQRELARRGFYDGAVDGVYGGKTDAAIRDFEQASQLKPSAEPNEALLKSIKAVPVKAAALTPPLPVPRPVPRYDPIAEILGPSKRVMSIQRALADFGYGQIKVTGVINPETEAAIEKFERERKLPITGQVSDRLARELASMTGRPLD